jgi:ABC-type multidrug transport system ATPase subunit
VQVDDGDVIAEHRRVDQRQYPVTSSLVMHNMRKAFSPTKVAVKGVSMAVDSDTIFGLLGPNGAGKTTLINILTGLYEASSGDATIDGYRVGSQMRDVYMSIGVCPQHDVLWGDLTVEDHLLFYARLKGVPAEREAATIDTMLANMSLQKFRNRQTKSLSGGEKRRVSIAIALIGDGKVIFLDEPTVRLPNTLIH